MYSSRYLELLVEELAKLPSIGQKSAQRLALHLLRGSKEDSLRLAEAIRAVKERVGLCGVCGNFSDDDPCRLCSDPARDGSLVCVVEQPGDVIAFERTGLFRGRYHVLGGALSPLDGTHPEDLRIKPLLERLRGDTVKEIILATNPNVAGEATASISSSCCRRWGYGSPASPVGCPWGRISNTRTR
jgi:recombination protein RecR